MAPAGAGGSVVRLHTAPAEARRRSSGKAHPHQGLTVPKSRVSSDALLPPGRRRSSTMDATVGRRRSSTEDFGRRSSAGGQSEFTDSDGDDPTARSFRSAHAFAAVDTEWALALVPSTTHGGGMFSRWWLDDRGGGQSGSEGLFEVVSGMVALWSAPNEQAAGLGLLRAGTRFRGTPEHVNGAAWIKLRSNGVVPPVFSPGGPAPEPYRAAGYEARQRRRMLKSSRSAGSAEELAWQSEAEPEASRQTGTPPEHPGHKLFRSGTPHPLLREPGLELFEEVWVEYNKQYIHRLRDTNRERGFLSYSQLSSTSWPGMDKKSWRDAVAKRRVVVPSTVLPAAAASTSASPAASPAASNRPANRGSEASPAAASNPPAARDGPTEGRRRLSIEAFRRASVELSMRKSGDGGKRGVPVVSVVAA